MPTRGVLWVSSRITQPTHLKPETFCEWYENIHIQQVLSLPGVPSANRYEAIDTHTQNAGKAWSHGARWLTVYAMPDISYRQTNAFRKLDGQSEPEQELLEGVFRNVRFDTRFYAEVQVFEKEGGGKGPARFLISAAFQPAPGQESDFDAWYREEHLAVLLRAPGFVRTRRYELVNGTTLDQFVRSEPEVPKYLALHEFEGDVLPWKELGESAQTEWAKRVMGGLVGEEVGLYTLKREYPESEWGGAGVAK